MTLEQAAKAVLHPCERESYELTLKSILDEGNLIAFQSNEAGKPVVGLWQVRDRYFTLTPGFDTPVLDEVSELKALTFVRSPDATVTR